MNDKHPKDMTVSEQLRKAGNGYEGANGTVMMNLIDLMGLSRKIRHSECLYALADKIDAELAQARDLSLRRGAELWAKANGWPDFREGEDFGAWLDRCFIPRPRFEDGEPVHIGDKAEHPYTGETCTIDCINTFDGSYCLGFVDRHSASLLDRERVKRPAPEALGADGLPIKVGETVWSIHGIHEGIVKALNVNMAHVEWSDGRWSPSILCDKLTHTPPDTQEKIGNDATMPPAEYCAVRGIDLGDDPDMATATEAMVRDLLRRQREYDKRKGGK